MIQDASPGLGLLFLREAELRQGLDLLYFAGRDLTAEAEAALETRGLSGAHYPVLHFLASNPGMSVGELTRTLNLTKQSLGRLTQSLAAAGLVMQRAGVADRRQRLYFLTEAGAALERDMWERQRPRIARAWRECGPQAVEAFRAVLLRLIERPADRRRFERADVGGPS